MSASRCFRCAVEACRPVKISRPFIKASTQCRTFASRDRSDITSGFPLPEVNPTPQPPPSASQEEKKVLENVTAAPPKRRTPPIARLEVTDSQSLQQPTPTPASTSPFTSLQTDERRPVPPNVIAAYRSPLKHKAPYGVPVASLQLRSYSVRNLEFFADFALRVAFYLNLPASGPVPLPKRTERWTMPRSNFVHKKSQENFERVTMRRLITIMDGEKSAVETWLACLRKWQYYGVGMKANVWEWSELDVSSKMDKEAGDLEKELDAKLANFGWNKNVAGSKSIEHMLQKQGFRQVGVPGTEVREGSRHSTTEL